MESPEQPAQPSKQAAYDQSQNPVTQTPQEQRVQPHQRQRGDPVSFITRRTADSKPSNDKELARLKQRREQEQKILQAASDVDLEYGVEEQPAEGDIARAVRQKSERAQAGAHAGPVGSAQGPGNPGFGEERDLAADMGRKREEHDRILGDRVGQSPAEPDGEAAEREALRQRKLKEEENLDVKGAVRAGTGDPVA
ncbi:uncharacterized protein NFIA_090100 [Aspergillus fischeri NRRL 181]|uniref:Uncharacterized protein n=1 Tax=Neosartorya fischeri (strain ATCC 1020 / DSM 3700 / CBS 544.65 / FGSC A1164 / JCM 1740 / NRRL 181 / WB 181) TaxID=331117 RepID=A1DI45_NEOFI|nr:conserved hypothetical protein [Aspergillus fischeri NRRL 181]EAW19052.1 conserved hypothetical protein [Aspergillus fischeri NRRL 181]KAG2021433.1 hypothetical protein GB937_004770 [Aspergillus fischeri]